MTVQMASNRKALPPFFVTGCGSKTKIPDNMIVVTPDAKELYLYMEREEVEKIQPSRRLTISWLADLAYHPGLSN